ncbi:Yar1p KNAG_0D00810 [Huiozyma naganishii CBS 8797]|uniref:Uncharacterized protein n=1 Tax=Huiozyma naganishii (strain ATCC MYA-139 / BCRC 22969 / CBS 8797 / KCTC 17520 / NBRC 10181 / NCYC 3082 / Yp74L-3) TaxID=1071383 RepID=J7RK00_HUIN7|nr:hypothetical protein KNAG_0D00810 [Kazachstania naganishii CBS 8797]CCK69833.1 hypothetical protein KNAG_0D00810 [Kazachstania naganishii CBS 8797]
MTLHNGPLDQEDQDAIILDARAGDLESLKEVFETLIDPSRLYTCRDLDTNSTALHMAAGNGYVDVVEYILGTVPPAELKKYVNLQNNTGNTALHWASLNGKLDVVELLCDKFEADPFLRNQFGHDAIFEAENNGKEEVENFFLKKYDVEPESDDEDRKDSDGKKSNVAPAVNQNKEVQISEGTEIESITKEATEALKEQTEKLTLQDN